jgi:serine/threonine protein kinase
MERAIDMAASFDFKERLGTGHFGEVWRVVDTGLNASRALKLIPPGKVWNPSNIFHEAQILKQAEHPNVVKVEETGTMSDGKIYVAMEYLPKGSLEDEAKGAYVPLTRAQRIMIDALRGLQHAHEKGIIHRDIKPANILVGSNKEGKLSDFGLAVPKSVNLKALGAKDYAYILHLAPEIHSGGKYTILSDIYAAGVTLYRLINGDMFLPSVAPDEVRQACLEGKFPDRANYREFVPRPMRMLVNRAIDVNRSRRFASAEEMRHTLEQLVIQMNWNEQALANGTRWASGWNSRCYEVVRIHEPNGKWSVETRKGGSRHSLRRVGSLCGKDLSKGKAVQLTKRVLQDHVLGRLR